MESRRCRETVYSKLPDVAESKLCCIISCSAPVFSLFFQYFCKSTLSAYEVQHVERVNQGLSETLLENHRSKSGDIIPRI